MTPNLYRRIQSVCPRRISRIIFRRSRRPTPPHITPTASPSPVPVSTGPGSAPNSSVKASEVGKKQKHKERLKFAGLAESDGSAFTQSGDEAEEISPLLRTDRRLGLKLEKRGTWKWPNSHHLVSFHLRCITLLRCLSFIPHRTYASSEDDKGPETGASADPLQRNLETLRMKRRNLLHRLNQLPQLSHCIQILRLLIKLQPEVQNRRHPTFHPPLSHRYSYCSSPLLTNHFSRCSVYLRYSATKYYQRLTFLCIQALSFDWPDHRLTQ